MLQKRFSFAIMIGLLCCGFYACKKDDTTTSKPPVTTTPEDTVSATKTCYDASGSLKISNMGFAGFDCNIACAFYQDVSNVWPGAYTTTITCSNQTGFGQTINFVFNGKNYPKSGTYKAVTMYGMMGSTGKIGDDEVVVHFLGPISSRKEQNNTVEVVNDKGKITIRSAKIELFDISGNAKSVVSELDLTKSTTMK